jgi:hypothetical protein
MKAATWTKEASRGLRGPGHNCLKSLSGGYCAEVREFIRNSLISLTSSAAAEVPPNIPPRACARVWAARMRVQVFVR